MKGLRSEDGSGSKSSRKRDEEARLIQRAQQGGKAAITELYRRHVDAVYRYFWARVRDETVAEDLTAQVFLKAREGLPTYRHTGKPFLAWLYRIAYACIVDYWRQQEHLWVSGSHELQQGTVLPRILHSGLSPRRPRRHDQDCACAHSEPAALVTGSASALYDCDCGLFHQASRSYDCDCGLVLDVARSYDCDCGLFLDGALGTAEPLPPVLWVRQNLPPPVSLEGDWRAYFNPSGPVGIATLNLEAQRVLTAFETPTSPHQAAGHLSEMSRAAVGGVMVDMARVGLLQPATESSRVPAQSSTLSAWLHITEACNLNCPYCYVQKRPTTMSEDVGYRAVDKLVQVAAKHGYTALKLKYAGGEPTLSFPLVEAVHTHAARAAARAGLALEGVILTNGAGVTNEMLDFLQDSRLRMMVSLDGGLATHDRVRASRDGQSTYAAVVGTVRRALDRGMQPTISITLTAFTLDGAAEAVAFALDRDLPFNLNFYRECAAASEGPSPLAPDLGQLVETVRRVFDLIGVYPAYPLPLTGILDRTRLDIPHEWACSAGRDYLAVNTRGQISACQMLLEDPWASLADADPLDAIRRSGTSVFSPPPETSDCHDCPWRAACAGGCPLMRDTPNHAHYCQAYQVLLPELVRLEAQRLIAAHSSQSPCFQ